MELTAAARRHLSAPKPFSHPIRLPYLSYRPYPTLDPARQLLLGSSKSERSTFQLDADPNKYAYLRSAAGKATARRGEDASEYKVTLGVLQMLKVKDDMIAALFQALSGLLALGSVVFSENPNGDSLVAGQAELQRASNLLGTNISLLQQALCSRTMKLKGSEMQIPLKPGEACSSRDALAKAIYLKLFGWVVTQVNSSLLDAKVTPLPRPHSPPRPHPHPRSHL